MSAVPQILLTGFPSGLLARRVLAALLASKAQPQVSCLTPPKQLEAAEQALRELPP